MIIIVFPLAIRDTLGRFLGEIPWGTSRDPMGGSLERDSRGDPGGGCSEYISCEGILLRTLGGYALWRFFRGTLGEDPLGAAPRRMADPLV